MHAVRKDPCNISEGFTDTATAMALTEWAEKLGVFTALHSRESQRVLSPEKQVIIKVYGQHARPS